MAADSSDAALASSSARRSASFSEAASAALRSHLSASCLSPRAYIASAVESAHATSSLSSLCVCGIGPTGVLICTMQAGSVAQPTHDRKGDRSLPGRYNPAMLVTVNGAARDVPDGLTVRGLVEHLGLTEGPVAVEINHEVVPRASHTGRRVAAGDEIEIVHFVGGG